MQNCPTTELTCLGPPKDCFRNRQGCPKWCRSQRLRVLGDDLLSAAGPLLMMRLIVFLASKPDSSDVLRRVGKFC